ncbi:uncharacterized protein LOC126802562 [Argentina anserina]|uniref:uncharacterized protein LOC126802562 n=1 Tax=Argentina anserina TaxID=57926 RepID=UPI0021767B97|nr:uncharacterized protein LOC126802562 [Potentilla anserina]
MTHQLSTYKNLILHLSLSLSLTLLLTFLKLPILFLHSLHTYIHPDHINPSSSSSTAAIRRPGSDPISHPELRKRPKPKSKAKNNNPTTFDENNAQIFRLKLDEAHLQTRIFFRDYTNAFTFSSVAAACLALQIYLGGGGGSSGDKFLAGGVFVPVLLSFAGVSKLVAALAKVSAEKSASRRSEKQLSFAFGVVGFVLGSVVCFRYGTSALDFNFATVDSNGRLFVAILMGCFAGFLFMPAAKNARAFWLGTDQVRSDLGMISCEWFGRLVLYVNYVMSVFTVLLWINPFCEMLVNKNNGKVRNVDGLIGNIGFSASEFGTFRVWCLLISGFLQLVALRPNLQMYLNEALLCWYQRLHAGKVPDLEFSRAKVFLHNHYLCLVVLQFLAPPVLLLLFLGLSRVEGISSDDYRYACSVLPCSAFVREVGVFLAWWILFVWAVYTSATIFLFRRCFLYMS